MGRFKDPRLEEIYHYRLVDGLPRDVCAAAHRIVRLVVAARELSTLTLFSPLTQDGDGGYALPVHKSWHITFSWLQGHGASDLQLEKL